MPVSPKEAKENLNSTVLSDKETQWFNLICVYTDDCIINNFDGDNAVINLENLELKNPIGGWNRNRYNMASRISPIDLLNVEIENGMIKFGPEIFNIPNARQQVIIGMWMEIYDKIGWKITEQGNDLGNYFSEYKFEVKPESNLP